ncbi:MAG: septum formation initiator family protein [Oscillospiraceae bacterium]|nr:septum formation initiator family protein [Oscillospiraceae bacterium]
MSAYIAGIILIGFIVFSIISTNMKINESKAQYNELVTQTNNVLEENASIERYLGEDANMDQYIEDIARDKLDFATPDERVYYIVPSSE